MYSIEQSATYLILEDLQPVVLRTMFPKLQGPKLTFFIWAPTGD